MAQAVPGAGGSYRPPMRQSPTLNKILAQKKAEEKKRAAAIAAEKARQDAVKKIARGGGIPKKNSALKPKPAAKPAAKPKSSYSSGSGGKYVKGYEKYAPRGISVADLQRRLGISADGIFGPNTLNAIKNFQRSRGLAVDGIVGPNTLAALNGRSSGGSKPSGGGYKAPAKAPAKVTVPTKKPTAPKPSSGGGALPAPPSRVGIGTYKPPAAIDPSKYKTTTATLADLAAKYGFTFKREDAARQAAAEAAAKQKEIDTARMGAQQNERVALSQMDQDFFQQFRAQAQNQVNSGLNAGIAADQDLRMGMNMQNAMGQLKAETATEMFRLNKEQQGIKQEELARTDELYNERLQQMFDNSLALTDSNRANNQQNFDQATEVRNRGYDESWARHQFNNMSYTDWLRYEQDRKQFGEQMAMEKFLEEKRLAQESAYNNSMAGYYNGQNFNQGSKGGGSGAPVSTSGGYGNNWKTKQAGNSATYKAFTGHLSAALGRGGFPSSWSADMIELVGRESSWNPSAKNPSSTAHGYGQFLKSTRANYEKKYGIPYTTPENQLILMMHYVKDRYGSPKAALQFWDKNKWY